MKQFIILIFGALAAHLAAFTPVLNRIEPRGGKIGSDVEIHFYGDRLESVSEAIFYELGLALTDIDAKDPKHVIGKFHIAPDATLGEHSLRLRTPGGLTELKSFWVGQFPTLVEAEPNATFDQAQKVDLNTTVQGVSQSEDDDYYVCSLKKGQRLSVEVEAMRLGRTMFDAYVAILDPKRFELASCDDSSLLRTDPFASIIAPEDGNYYILIHEAAYEGSDACQYRLHIGTFPRPKAIFPTGGKPGETIEFTFIGDPFGPIKQTITLPPGANPRSSVFPIHDCLSAPSPHYITVSPLEYVSEIPGVHDFKSATPLPSIPCAAHGLLAGPEKADWFKFSAKKGQELVVRVIARSHRSPLDSVLSIHDKDGKSIARNDDQGAPDSVIVWPCPTDGDYFLKLRDQLDRTGPDFTYRIEIITKSPSLAATLPTAERNNTQKWKTFPVPRGNRYAAVINLVRENIACDATFNAITLPSGISLHAPPIPRSVTSFPVVLEATPDAPVAGSLHEFVLSSTGEPKLSGRLLDTINHVEVNNEGIYHSITVDRISTAVTEEAPFKIDLETPAVPLVQGGTIQLKTKITRAPGYAEKIAVRFLWNPPGVTGPVSIEVPGDQTEATYELNATADATPADWQVCVMAESNTPKGPVLVSSSLTPLKVAEPYLAMTLDLAATEQGRDTSILAKIENKHTFAGNATATLTGLPHGASTPPQTFSQDQKEITFPVTIAPDAQLGKHNAIFCRVTVPENGTTILHQTALNSTLRIDAPTKTSAPPQPKPADPQAKAEISPSSKPLSRLEQLRQKSK